jgi:hypothetical protein
VSSSSLPAHLIPLGFFSADTFGGVCNLWSSLPVSAAGDYLTRFVRVPSAYRHYIRIYQTIMRVRPASVFRVPAER